MLKERADYDQEQAKVQLGSLSSQSEEAIQALKAANDQLSTEQRQLKDHTTDRMVLSPVEAILALLTEDIWEQRQENLLLQRVVNTYRAIPKNMRYAVLIE